jgi:DNA-binding MarR family transcriptional regulator
MAEQRDPASRIGQAWRELRRGASMTAFVELLQGETGLDLGQLDTLEHIVLADRCRMSELAEAMRVDASTATRAVQRLVEAKLARRAVDTADARRVLVEATASGRALYEDLADRRRHAMLEILDDLALDERCRLADSLEHLVAGLDRFVERKTGATRRAAAS